MKKIYISVAVFLSLVAAPTRADFDLDQVRKDVEALNREWAVEIWNADVYGTPVDRASVLAEYPQLTSKELVDFLRAKYEEETDPVEKQRLRLLFRDISGTYIFEKMAGLYDEIDNARTRAVFYGEDFEEPVAYRELPYYYANLGKDELEKRAEVYFMGVNFTVNVLNPMHEKRITELRENCRELSFDNYTAYDEYATGFDHSALSEQAYRFLDDTQEMYETVVTDKCREILGKSTAETVPWERGIVWHTKEFDEYFPPEDMLPFAYDFFGGMGLELKDNPNITIDDTDRDTKEPRPACYSVKVPDDIRVNLKPLGGMDDYSSVFHESGHALHYAYTDPDLPYEFRHLGTNSLSETYAFLFQGLFLNPTFLEEEAGMPKEKVEEYMDIAFMSELSGARYYAMNVIYEARLHGPGTDDPLTFFRELHGKYGVFPRKRYQDEVSYLDGDEEFYSRDYMTAWYAEAQLRARLEERFGTRWYKDPAAGEFLKSLFARGDSWTTEDMLKYVGYEGLDSSYLAEDFARLYEAYSGRE